MLSKTGKEKKPKKLCLLLKLKGYFSTGIHSLRDLKYSTRLAILDMEPSRASKGSNTNGPITLLTIINNLTCLNPDKYFIKNSPSGLPTRSSHSHTLWSHRHLECAGNFHHQRSFTQLFRRSSQTTRSFFLSHWRL